MVAIMEGIVFGSQCTCTPYCISNRYNNNDYVLLVTWARMLTKGRVYARAIYANGSSANSPESIRAAYPDKPGYAGHHGMQSPWNAISDEQRISVERHDLEPPLVYLCLRFHLLYIILSDSIVSIPGIWHYPFWFLPFTIRQMCNINIPITRFSLPEAIGHSFFCNWRTFLPKW